MNIENMTSKELKATAKELKIKNWWSMKKTELIEAIQNAQNESQDEEETFVDTLLAEEERVNMKLLIMMNLFRRKRNCLLQA